jgi:uncharacterized protein (DUF488 family)
MSEPSLVVCTIGHATRTVEAFEEMLRAREVSCVADVRTVPRSRKNPQFNQDTLPNALRAAGIEYAHLPRLGGLRRARADSPNKAWHNLSFRGYADYMDTPEFAAGLDELLALARQRRTALMCAESVPWRCHRSLIADALVIRGVSVEHILPAGRLETHRLTPWARVEGLRITYPPELLADAPEGAAVAVAE